MSHLSATLLIPHYNNLDFLTLILGGLTTQKCQDFEVIICDDGSSFSPGEEIPQDIKDTFGSRLSQVQQTDKGFRKSRILNKGILSANTDYIIIIDQDCIPHPQFINAHLRHREKGYFLGGQRTMLSEGATQSLLSGETSPKTLYNPLSFMLFCNRHKTCERISSGIYLPSVLENLARTRTKQYDLLGCNMSLWKSDLVNICGFEETFEEYGYEDLDIQRRLELAGITMKRIRHSAVCYHLHHQQKALGNQSQMIFMVLEDQNDIQAQNSIFHQE